MYVTLKSVLNPDQPHFVMEKPRCVIGRARECDIQEPSSFVSQFHCEVLIDGETVVVHDLGSRNGTFVNGRRIDGDTPLHDGDRLVVAFVPYDVEIQPAEDDESRGLWLRWSQILGTGRAQIV